MRTHRTTAVVLSMCAALVACEDKSSGGGPAPSASAPTAQSAPSVSATASAPSASATAPAPATPDRGGRHGGPVGMFFRAARDLPDLKDAQKSTVDKLEASLKVGDGDPMRTEMKSLHDDLVAGIKAGKIDTAKMTAHYAAMDKLGQARTDKEAEALNGLYAALDATQRKAVAATVRAKQIARDDKMRNWAAAHDAGAADWTKKRVDRLTADVGLDDAQQKSVSAILAKGPTPATMDAMRDAGKKRTDALVAAFEKDGFDAKKMDLSMVPGKKPHDMIQMHVDFATQVLAVLKPEQREKFAAGMDKRPDAAGERAGSNGGWSEGAHDDD